MKIEQVLVVPRSRLFSRSMPDGFFNTDAAEILENIATFAEFRWRHTVEEDPSLKQIIPYAVITYGSEIFLLQRHTAQSEARLHHKYSLGVGGHINPIPGLSGPDLLEQGLLKELHEEIALQTAYRYHPVGFLNEEDTPVSQVHFGVVYRVEVDQPEVAVAETDKMSGSFVSLDAVRAHYEAMETWSQRLVDRLEEVIGSLK